MTNIRRHRSLACGIGLALAALTGAACSSDSTSSDTTVTATSTGDTTSDGTTIVSDTTAASVAPNDTDGTNAAGGDGYSVAAWLEQIPASVVSAAATDGSSGDSAAATTGGGSTGDGAPLLITSADLDEATKLLGLTRPAADPIDPDAVIDWLLPLTGVVREGATPLVAVQLPNAVNPRAVAQVDQFRDELGWSVADVHAYIELANPPHDLTVLSGDFDESAIETAIGAPDDGIYEIGDEDYGTDISSVSAARPIGQSVRIALDGDLLADARATPLITEWQGRRDGPTLADDDAIAAVAAALDGFDVYAAIIQEGGFDGAASRVPPDVSAALGDSAGLGPFVAVGVGLTVADGKPVAVFTYSFPDAESASTGADRLTDLIENGASLVSQQPWSDRFAIREIRSDGDVVTAALDLKDILPSSVWQIVYTRDNIVTGS